MILISLCTVAQEWAAHFLNLCLLADAAVTSESMADLLKWTSRTYACSNLVWCTAFMVMMSTNCLICLPMKEKKGCGFFFLVSPLMEWFAVIIYYLGIFVWAIFVWRVVSQRLVELKVFSRDIQVVISFLMYPSMKWGLRVCSTFVSWSWIVYMSVVHFGLTIRLNLCFYE